MRRAFFLLPLLALAPFAAEPASAQQWLACEVVETPDGFVAIRVSPSPSGALVAQASPGQIVEVQASAGRKPVARGKWWRVRHYPGQAMPQEGEAAFKHVREGWMHSRYIAGCDR